MGNLQSVTNYKVRHPSVGSRDAWIYVCPMSVVGGTLGSTKNLSKSDAFGGVGAGVLIGRETAVYEPVALGGWE